MRMFPPLRLAIVVSHPIQHFVHFYRALAAREDIVLKVFFCAKIGMETYFDRDMNSDIRWADDMTGGFDHQFLPGAEQIKHVSLLTVDNPGVGACLEAFAPDAVMVYGYAQLSQLKAIAWSRLHRVPVLMMTDSNDLVRRNLPKRLLRNTATRAVFSQVTAFLTVGDSNEASLQRAGVPLEKMHRSPMTIDETRYEQAWRQREARRQSIRQHHSIPDTAFLAIAIGKFIARKRMGDVVEAFARLAEREDGRQMWCLICGNGPQHDEIAARIQSCGARVVLAGFVNVDRLPDYVCAADVLVHCAERDAHPLICAEAACLGLPMVLSDQVGTVGPSDIARINQNAIVYPCGDVAALADTVHLIASRPGLSAEMSLASRRIYTECNMRASVMGMLRALSAAVPVRRPS